MYYRLQILANALLNTYVWVLCYLSFFLAALGISTLGLWVVVLYSIVDPLIWLYWVLFFTLLLLPIRFQSVRFKVIALSLQFAITAAVFGSLAYQFRVSK